MNKVLLSFILIPFFSLASVYSDHATHEPLKIYSGTDSNLVMAELSFVSSEEHNYHYRSYQKQNKHWHVQIKSGANTIKSMYTVIADENKNHTTLLFRLPLNKLNLDNTKVEKLSFSLHHQNGQYNNRHHGNYQHQFGGKSVHKHKNHKSVFEINKDASIFIEKEKTWMKLFKRELESSIAKNEDHELEHLLYLRWFGDLPNQQYSSWKSDPILRAIFTLSGFNDIRDAIPANKTKLNKESQLTEAPKPLMLPLVTTKLTQFDEKKHQLSKYVPRSCYYVSWDSAEDFEQSMTFIAQLVDQWSPGTYPLSTRAIISKQRKRIGLDKNYVKKFLKGKVNKIVLAGWDPYFQSGTNFMVLIESKEKINAPKGSAIVSQPNNNILILSTSDKLSKMSAKAFDKKKSLLQENNFRYSRKRMDQKEKENEKFFLYLSDYWLINLLSPRWKISIDRRNELDAKIRLIHLLQLIYQNEKGLRDAPKLAELKKTTMLHPDWKNWLFKDMTEKDGRIQHSILGGLYNHPPIDTVTFNRVTEEEKKNYERFKQHYSRRWREVDPLALQIVDNGERWITRLYLSPISNNSFFRMLQTYFPNPKVTHSFEKIKDQALGLSVALNAPMFRSFGLRGQIPLVAYIQMMSFDFAPTSYGSATWLRPKVQQDEISYFRAPVSLIVPRPLFRMLPGAVGRFNQTPSQFEGINLLQNGFLRERYFPIYALSKDKSPSTYLSFNPDTLKRVQSDDSTKTFVDDTVPSDIRLFADLKNGYMLKRKVMQEAVKNRTLALWRRHSRLWRINQFLGDSDSRDHFNNNHAFPTYLDKYASIVNSLPNVKGDLRQHYWSGTSAKNYFSALPKIISELSRIDSYISIEDNGLFFENHLEFETVDRDGNPVQNETGVNQNQNPNQNEATLDFDDE